VLVYKRVNGHTLYLQYNQWASDLPTIQSTYSPIYKIDQLTPFMAFRSTIGKIKKKNRSHDQFGPFWNIKNRAHDQFGHFEQTKIGHMTNFWPFANNSWSKWDDRSTKMSQPIYFSILPIVDRMTKKWVNRSNRSVHLIGCP